VSTDKESLTRSLEWVRIFGFNIPMPKSHKIALVTAAQEHLRALQNIEEIETKQKAEPPAPALKKDPNT